MSRASRHSLQARVTLAAGALSLVVLALIGLCLDVVVRTSVEGRLYAESQRVATDLIGWRPAGGRPELTPDARVTLLQIVDAHGRVAAASPDVAGTAPLSTMRPPIDDRIEHGVQCSAARGCLLLTAVRIPPLETRVNWHGQPHYIFAGTPEPPLLERGHLQMFTGAVVVLAAALAAWGTWLVVGHTLAPVAAIRARMAEISVSDLSLRVPQPPGRDEIAQLARTANRTLARLEESVKYQRSFASVVSHELRNPVAGLQALLEEAVLYPGEVDPHETIRASLSTTERLRAIIDDVLVFARIRIAAPAEPEPVDLCALVREEAAARVRGVPVHARADGRVTVLGNRIQLIRVLVNLLANAQRHAERLVEVTVERTDDQAVLTVADDGGGIPPEQRECVFEPFVRLEDGRRRDPDGSGLGLAICRAIAVAHNGSLGIEDSACGARFVLRLPLADEDHAYAGSDI